MPVARGERTSKHGGPVAGLLTRALEACRPCPGTRLTSIAVDIFGPVPLGVVRLTARVERPGRRIELLSASMQAPDRQGGWWSVATATAWRLATQPTQDVVHHAETPEPLPEPGTEGLHDQALPEPWRVGGFVAAHDWRVAERGSPGRDTVAWIHLTRPLVEGEATSDLVTTVALADVANGIGARLDPFAFRSLNTDLRVHLYAPPTGPWVGLQAETSVGPEGAGMSSAVIHTVDGPVGRLAQNVLVERMTPAGTTKEEG